jgi:ribonuclease E
VPDDVHNQDQSESPAQWEPPAGEVRLPDRMRVHSLARVLGTTSRRVLDALAELDGRTRSPHSGVDQADAIRVRDALSAADAGPIEAEVIEEPELVEVASAEFSALEPVAQLTFIDPTAAVIIEAEPESQLVLVDHSAPLDPVEEQPAYMPLFVAPQPVAAVTPEFDEDDSAEDLAEVDDESDEADADADAEDRPASRRRRRGRRGRGRGRGEQAGSEGEDDEEPADTQGVSEATEESDEDDGDESADDDSASGEGATRRRRRRRRRRAGTGEDGEAVAPDDPPNTVVHERAPRTKAERPESNEIQGISGSTRLEAKRQRRRDGRDAGRRRPPILTEAEFLARREAVDRVMVVREKVRTEPPHEGAFYTQIAVLEDGIVVEHFVTSAGSASLVGNIYLGIVQNVLPSMEAAFVDIGRGRNGVLYAGEVNWEAAGLGGTNRKIEQALKPGDYVVVQVSKDPVGHKGARLTTQISLAGRYLVYVPGASSTGISRKLPDTERQRLKEILREVVPADAGVIIRTASEGVKEDDIHADVSRLQERWNSIAEEAERVKGNRAGAAVALYEEPDVLVKVIRDLFNEDFSRLIVSGDHSWDTINGYVNSVAPELVSKLTKYEPAGGGSGPDVFAVHRIDEQLTKALDRKVWLPSGGTLVIDRTEAMTVVDVNTGKFTGAGGNLEQTVTKNNLEAAEEVVRQLRLRDIGGIIVIDFIDMVLESNRDLVLRRLTEALARDRTRHQVSEVTSLGLVQLTRKRLGTGLVEAFSSNCAHCSGRGIMLHADPVDNDSAPVRKTEAAGGRRSRRGRRGKVEEPAAVVRIPTHVSSEHPMFRAMAASKGDDEDSGEDFVADELAVEFDGEEAPAVNADLNLADLNLAPDIDEDIDEDEDDLDEDDDDLEDDEGLEDEEGLEDDGLEDDDEDDEIGEIGEDDDIELDEVDDDAIDAIDAIDEDESLEIVDSEPDLSEDLTAPPEPEPAVAGRRPRRRAAARPAGPPALDH